MIEIKAWFSDWREVSMEKAVEFYRHIFEVTPLVYRKSQFSKHFRGVEWKTLEKLSGKGGAE